MPSFDVEAQQLRLEELSGFAHEYNRLARTMDDVFRVTPDKTSFRLDNGLFGSVDAELLWAMVRDIRPEKVVEIGAGWTTVLISQALEANERGEVISIDPAPPEGAFGYPRSTIHARELQDIGDILGGLSEGDILFVDGSHQFKVDGEIDLVLRALPGMSGVTVQFHDIFLPSDYPPQWMDRGYDEQVYLEAYLTDHPEDEILIAANFLHENASSLLSEFCESYDPQRAIGPGSLWFRTSVKRAAATRKPKRSSRAVEQPEPEPPKVANSETVGALM